MVMTYGLRPTIATTQGVEFPTQCQHVQDFEKKDIELDGTMFHVYVVRLNTILFVEYNVRRKKNTNKNESPKVKLVQKIILIIKINRFVKFLVDNLMIWLSYGISLGTLVKGENKSFKHNWYVHLGVK